MSIKQTTLFPPPLRGADLPAPLEKFLLTLQMLTPMVEADTTAGNIVVALPAAGLNTTTGQSNQNQEIIYTKTSADANTLTITGAASGTVILGAQFAVARFKSNGSVWRKSN